MKRFHYLLFHCWSNEKKKKRDAHKNEKLEEKSFHEYPVTAIKIVDVELVILIPPSVGPVICDCYNILILFNS